MELEKFADRPVVTRDSVSAIAELRRKAANVASAKNAKPLQQAAEATVAACQSIDTPEQRAVEAFDSAIVLLETREYRRMLQQFTVPQELEELQKAGRFEEVVARFEGGWGLTLLQKLKAARTVLPAINEDGTIEFRVPGAYTQMSAPVTMIEIAGRWYFRD